jgi:hypothetical protein
MQLEQQKDLRDSRPAHPVQACQVRLVSHPSLQPPAELLRESQRRLYGRRPPNPLLRSESPFRFTKIDDDFRADLPRFVAPNLAESRPPEGAAMRQAPPRQAPAPQPARR